MTLQAVNGVERILTVGGQGGDFALARYQTTGGPIPGLSISDASVTEGNSGTTQAIFTVTMTVAGSEPITVDYTTGDYTAKAGSDYVATSGRLTFSPGETSKTIAVLVNGDVNYEPDEYFYMFLPESIGAVFVDSWSAGTIANDDNQPRISINDVSLKEGRNGMGAFVFTVSLSSASYQPVSISYATADGTANAGSDYQAASGTLTFNPGETSKTITVWVVGDSIKESDEAFYLDLSNALYASVEDGRGMGTILNDDR